MATKDQKVARNLLEYRYHHLEKAIENAKKLGFSNGADSQETTLTFQKWVSRF